MVAKKSAKLLKGKKNKAKADVPPFPVDGQLNIDARPAELKDYENLTDKQRDELVRQARKNRAMLISGSTGNGKTTLALLLAKLVAGDPRNVFERNCGTDGGVDEIRKVVATADIPSLYTKGNGRKVFIFDEAHKLSQAAASALLTPLESPRKDGALFIFVTNHPNSLLDTFRKRCVSVHIPDWTREQLKAFNEKYAKKLRLKPLSDKQLAVCADPRSILTALDASAITTGGQQDESELKARSLLPILLNGTTNGRNLPHIDFAALMSMGRILRNMLGMPTYSDDNESRAYAASLLRQYDPSGKNGFNSDDIARVYHAVSITIQAASAGNVPPIVLLDVLVGHALSGEIVDMILGDVAASGKSKKAK